MAHEHNPFDQMENGWREHKVYEDMGHKVVDLAMTLRQAGGDVNAGSSSSEDVVPTPFPVDFFRSLAEQRGQ